MCLREWVKHDSEGQIIAKYTYLKPRLIETAVPTNFDNFTTSVPPVSDKPTDGVFDGSNFLEGQCKSVKYESFEESPMVTLDAECADESCAMLCAPQEMIQYEVLPVTPVPSARTASLTQKVVDSASIVRMKNFILSKITINDSTSNVVTSEKNPITIPTSWGATEYAEERGQRVDFSNIIRTNTNGTASTIINKSVKVEVDKTFRYCVYGSLIDPERCQLPPVLMDTTLLPRILERFRRLNVCLSLVDIHYLSLDSIFQDSVQRWRDKDCTIPAKQKRCEHCTKIQRERRLNKTENINRILHHLSNAIERRKKKISRGKRDNNYLK